MNTDFSTLLNIIGCKLISVIALIYVHNGEEMFPPQELLLNFESNKRLKLVCSSDGESLVWNSGELKITNLGEYGEEIVKDISNLPYCNPLVGCVVTNVELIKSSDECLIGLKFLFEKLSLVIANLGDEIFISETFSEQIINEEKMTYHNIPLAK